MTNGVPYDAEIEYLESTGTQFLGDTILVERIGGISFDVEFTANGTPQIPFGSGPRPTSIMPDGLNTSTDRVVLVANVSNGEFIGCYVDTGLRRISNLHLNHKIGNRIVLPRTDTRVQAYNNRIFGVFCAYTYENKRSLWGAGGRIRSMTLWDTSGDLLRDYIPVRVGTTGYLFDRVTRRLFGNAGSGSFVLGPDVARPILPARAVSVKPYDAEIEHLESTGTQYVDTGIVPTYDLAYTIDAAWVTRTKDVMMGSITDLGYISMGWRPGGSYIYHGRTTGSSFSSSLSNAGVKVRFSFDPQTGIAAIDTISGEIARTSIQSLRSFLLFGRHVRSDISMYPMRIFGAKFDNGTSVLDLIPVRRGTTGYLYDRVSGQLFGNAGTGSFVIGPDK